MKVLITKIKNLQNYQSFVFESRYFKHTKLSKPKVLKNQIFSRENIIQNEISLQMKKLEVPLYHNNFQLFKISKSW